MNSALLGSMAALSWGTHDFLARFPSRQIGPAHSVLGVTVAGFLVLSVWLLASGAKVEIVWPSLWLAAASGVAIALATLSLFTALSLGPISIVCPIAGSYPALAVLFAFAAGARPHAAEWLAILAVLLGVVAVSRGGGEGPEQPLPGRLGAVVGLSALASLGFATALISGQAAAPIFGEAEAVWLARIFGLATIALAYLRPAARRKFPARWLPIIGTMGGLDVLALVATMGAGHLPDPQIATVTSSAFGAVSVVLARIFLKERITPVQLIGIVLIFGGVGFLASR